MENQINEISYLVTDLRGFFMQVRRCHTGAFSIDQLSPFAISGSGMPGWQPLEDSDLLISSDPSWWCKDPFATDAALVFAQPLGEKGLFEYPQDPRAVAQRLETYVKSAGIADTISVGAELEFHLLKGARFFTSPTESFVYLDELDGYANNGERLTDGHRIGHHTMHMSLAPVDKFTAIRRKIADTLPLVGITPTHHLHEAGRSQQEIGVQHRTLTRAADEVQLQKYVIRHVAQEEAYTATFMPKPMAYSQGNGLHVNISLWKDGRNLLYSDQNSLSKFGMHFIAGVLAHARALAAITNPTTNSYRRLCASYSSKKNVGYGFRDRSAAIRIPHFRTESDCRVEIRFPDPSANPYLAFSALICAGLDGVRRGEDPPPVIKAENTPGSYIYSVERTADNSLPRNLSGALESLLKDRDFLEADGIFSKLLLDTIVSDASYFCHWADTVPSPIEYQCFFSM